MGSARRDVATCQSVVLEDPRSPPILIRTGVGELGVRSSPLPVTLEVTLPSVSFVRVPVSGG